MDKIKQNLSGKEFHSKKEDRTRLLDMLNQKDEIKSGPHAQTQSSRLPSPSPDVGAIRSYTDAERRIEIIDAEEVRVPNQSGLVIEVIIFICSYLEELSNGLGCRPNINSITQSERPRRSSRLSKDTDEIIASEDEDSNRLFTAQAAKQVREATGKINLWVDGLQILDGTLDENLPFREELRDALYLTFYTFLSHLQRLSKNTSKSILLLAGDVDILLEQLSAASPECRILDEGEGDSDDDAFLEHSGNDRYSRWKGKTSQEHVDYTPMILNSIMEELDEMIACLSELTPSLNDLLEEIWEKRYTDKVNTVKAAADAIEYKDFKPEDHLRRNLQDKFPTLSEGLGKRLAIASWQLYGSVQRALRKREMDRVRHSLEHSELDSTYESMEPTTIAASMLEYSLDPVRMEAFDLLSEGGESSVWFSDRPAIPPPPVDLDDDITFECQFCLKKLEGIRNMKQWRRHIFADIRPYICTFPDCELKGVRWGLRREWIEHEIDFHRRKEIWKCNVNGCLQEASLDSELEFIVKHIILTHSVTFSDFKQAICMKAQYLSRFPKSSSTQLPINDSSPCPFCREPVDNKRAQLERHLGRHLEDIALPVLSLLAERNSPEPEQTTIDLERYPAINMFFKESEGVEDIFSPENLARVQTLQETFQKEDRNSMEQHLESFKRFLSEEDLEVAWDSLL